MKEMFLTKEGVLTESIEKVYLSNDKEYYHTNQSIVKIYENFNIKYFDKLVPEVYDFKGQIFNYPEINGYDNSITYVAKDDGDLYLEFKIDSNFNKDTILTSKPKFQYFDRTSELYVDISEYDVENYLY